MTNMPVADEKGYKVTINTESRRFYKKDGKTIFFIKGGNQTKSIIHKTGLTFDLNSTKCPPQVKDFVPFDDDLIKLVKNLRSRKVDTKFQRTLAKDLKDIRSSNKILTTAEKMSSMYRLSKEEYPNLLQKCYHMKI